MMRRWELGAVSVMAPEPWCEITHELPPGSPFTMARVPDGCGALQFSFALYRSGREPKIVAEDLLDLLADFARHHLLGEPAERAASDGVVRTVAASFRREGDCLRAWCCSDGSNVALVTYVAGAGEPDVRHELADAEGIVRSLRFQADTRDRGR